MCLTFSVNPKKNEIGEKLNVEIWRKMFTFAAELYYCYGDRSYITGA